MGARGASSSGSERLKRRRSGKSNSVRHAHNVQQPQLCATAMNRLRVYNGVQAPHKADQPNRMLPTVDKSARGIGACSFNRETAWKPWTESEGWRQKRQA